MSLVDDFEDISSQLGQHIANQVNTNNQAIGDRPFDGRKLTENEQLGRYVMMRDDDKAWSDLIGQHGVPATVDYSLRMERLIQKHQAG